MSSKWCLSGNIMHYGFALLVMVQGCSGGGISTRVTLRNGVIFQSCITDLVALFYVDGFLRWLVLLVYLRPKSGRLLVNQLHWYEIVGRCWHAFACSKNECLHHVCISMLLKEDLLRITTVLKSSQWGSLCRASEVPFSMCSGVFVHGGPETTGSMSFCIAFCLFLSFLPLFIYVLMKVACLWMLCHLCLLLSNDT